jgi:hypothetical protein
MLFLDEKNDANQTEKPVDISMISKRSNQIIQIPMGL